jgi:trehalose-6-phosphatase
MKSKAQVAENRSFFSEVTLADHRVLLLDYEGVLAPLSLNDGRTSPRPEVWDLLKTVMQHHTRVITMSRWPACDVASWFGTEPIPEIWGNDGLERLCSGEYECGNFQTPVDLLRALAECELRLEEAGLLSRMNAKLSGVTIHWRGLTASEKLDLRLRACRVLQPFTVTYPALRLVAFEEGLELRLPLPSKADIVRRFADATPSGIPIAYLGHSTTDEETFRALNDRGLTILVRSVPRFTAAHVCLRPPNDLIAFLKDWITASRDDL